MKGSRIAALTALLAACGNEAPPLAKPAASEDMRIRVRKRPALAPLRDAPGLAALGAPGQGSGDGKLHLHILDVGHGDAALIVSPTGRTVLVDVGPPDAATFLANRLAEQVSQPLDILAITSPRPEYAGGLDGVLRAISADRLVIPAQDADVRDGLAATARARGVPVYAPGGAAGRPFTVELGGGAALELYGPVGAGEAGMVLRVTHGTTAVLFPGDAPLEAESELVRGGAALRSTLLKVGAHGLETSTGERWLAAVQPSAAILSFGPGNQEGAPSPGVMDRLRAAKVATWRTDLDGELHLQSDGEQVLLAVERPAAGEPMGVRHRYAQGQAPSRLAPTGVPMPRVASARPRPAAASPAETVAPREDLDVPTNWGKPLVAAGPVKKDDLEVPANWGKPAAPAPAPASRPTVPAPVPASAPKQATAPRPASTRPSAPSGDDDLSMPANWGQPATATAPAPTQAPAPSTLPATKQPAPARPAASAAGGYAASKSAKKFHTANCDAVGKIKPENLLTFKTREEAASGREPAKDCNP